jgi:hypothetical protein
MAEVHGLLTLGRGDAMPARRTTALAVALLGLLAAPASAGVGSSPPALGKPALASPGPAAAPEIAARFDHALRATRVTARAPGACAALDLPLAWTLDETAAPARLEAAQGGPTIDMNLRAARALPPVPSLASRDGALPADTDLPRRAAAALQREHEEALGRPAQSVALTALDAGAWRFTATWLDPNLPAPVTHDTVLLPLSPDWVLELTLDGASSRDMHEMLLGEVMERTRVGGC